MLNVLPESRRVRWRATTSGVISAAVHAGLIAAVAYASGAEPPPPPPAVDVPYEVVYRPPREATETPNRGESLSSRVACDCPPPAETLVDELPIVPPVEVSSTLPPPGKDIAGIVDWAREGHKSAVNGAGATSRGRAGAEGPLPNAYADKPAIALPDNPSPRYPEMLRAARMEGSVMLRFVIDSTGRVRPGTVEVLGSDHELFTAAVRAALPRMRFLAAEASGRRVAVLAEQRFEFRLKP